MNQVYENAMRRALELALLGPAWGENPQVGAVILDAAGNVIAEGFHRGAGTAHAEVDALSKLSTVPAGATAVVTLEPCNHTGRTGPCAQALIEAGISRVVYAVTDPGEFSSGGSETLRAAGIEVISGVLEADASKQLEVWLWHATSNHTWVSLKWASSVDGRAAANDGSSKWISGPESRNHAHLIRSQVDAILVGTGTIIADDPELTARKPDGSLYEHQPTRIVMGLSDLPADARVFNDAAPTWFIKSQSVHDVLGQLWGNGYKHVLVEGGPTVASAFVESGLVNDFYVYLAPKLIGGSRVALGEFGVESIGQAIDIEYETVERLGEDIFIKARSKNVHWDY